MVEHIKINKVLGAHGLWKQRLRDAIETGRSEFTADRVPNSNICEFGKWFNLLPDEMQQDTSVEKNSRTTFKISWNCFKHSCDSFSGEKNKATQPLAFGSELHISQHL